MSSSPNETRRPTDHRGLRAARNVVIGIGLLAVALFPFPWWW